MSAPHEDADVEVVYLWELKSLGKQAGVGAEMLLLDGPFGEDFDWGIGPTTRMNRGFWPGVTVILSCAGNMSKIFWPPSSSKFARARGKHLRDVLGIREQSPLRMREIRNDFEHFDERLDRWADRPGPKNYFGGGTRGDIGIEPVPSDQDLQNPSTLTLESLRSLATA